LIDFPPGYGTLPREKPKEKEKEQNHPVRPDIRLTGKDFIRQGLDGHPLDWHQLLASLKHKISN
jgi:hypothetical protein